MICHSCAAGGNLSATLPARRPGADITATNRHNGLRRRINNLHGKCRGGTWCDCQHRNTRHARLPEGAGERL